MHRLTEQDKNYLFRLAKEQKKKGETLTSAFEQVAKKAGLSSGTVRNFYYKAIGENGNLGLVAKKAEFFTREEELSLVKKVISERKNFPSLSKTFLAISKGDKKLALRYRNKFANMMKKERGLIMREVLNQKRLGANYYNPFYLKENSAKMRKLKGEIDELIERIGKKCVLENQLLKNKLKEYQKLKESESFCFGNLNKDFSENRKSENREKAKILKFEKESSEDNNKKDNVSDDENSSMEEFFTHIIRERDEKLLNKNKGKDKITKGIKDVSKGANDVSKGKKHSILRMFFKNSGAKRSGSI